MRKLITGIVLSMLCLVMVACGEKSDKDIVTDVQKKIEDAGWKISHDTKASEVLDIIELKINEKENFTFSMDKKVKNVDYIMFNSNASGVESLGYQTNSKEDDLYTFYDVTACSYNPIMESVNEKQTTYPFCAQEAPGKSDGIKTRRDKLLKKAGITLEDLYKWCGWYHTNND